MRIKLEDAVFALKCLIEGNSVRSTERLTGLDRNTILDLLLLAGERCEDLMKEKIRNMHVRQVQADEIWGFIYKKEKHKTSDEASNRLIGDAYTFVAIEAESKLILCFELGRRDVSTTLRFVDSLRFATSGSFQLTTDGFKPYIDTVEHVFGADIDFSQLV